MLTFWPMVKRATAISCVCLGVVLTSCSDMRLEILSPSEGAIVHPNALVVRIQVLTFNASNVTYATTVDGQATSCKSAGVYRNSSDSEGVLLDCPVTSEGSHRFEVTATDGSGNQASGAVTVKVDVPIVVSVTKPSAGETLTTNQVSVEFTSSGTIGSFAYSCQLDSGPAAPCTSPLVYSGLSDGAHTVVVSARDSAETASKRVSFLVNPTGKRPAPAKQVVVGDQHSCALMMTGNVRCWGSGEHGALGYGNTNNIGDDEFPSSAGDVDVGGEVVQITAGTNHTCALLANGHVRCWGEGYGTLGYGNTDAIGDDETPASAGDVDVGGDVAQIAAGSSHTCALLVNGKVRCWGARGYEGQLGYGNTNAIGDDETPASAGDINVGGDVVQIAAGGDHTCALLANGKVRCWGDSSYGQLGYALDDNTIGAMPRIGDNEPPASAGDVPIVENVAQIAAGQYHTCAVLADGHLRCWGGLTIGDPSKYLNVPFEGLVTKVFAGAGNTCWLLPTHTAYCYAAFSQIPFMGDIDAGGAVEQVALSFNHACFLLTTGQVRCSGLTGSSALGYATTQLILDPVTQRPVLSPAQAGDVFLGF